MFTRELLQAVNDWQRGGDAKQKRRRGANLKHEVLKLPGEFRECGRRCFRQIALRKDSLWRLADELELPEAISAWTLLPSVAEMLKSGVPPADMLGVIFAVVPSRGSVVANLHRLYQSPHFLKAVERDQG